MDVETALAVVAAGLPLMVVWVALTGFVVRWAVGWAVRPLEKRLDRVDDGMDRLTEAVHSIDKRLTRVEDRLTNVEDRLTSVEGRLTNVEDRLTSVEGRLTNVEDRLTQIEARHTEVEYRLTEVEGRQTETVLQPLALFAAEGPEGAPVLVPLAHPPAPASVGETPATASAATGG